MSEQVLRELLVALDEIAAHRHDSPHPVWPGAVNTIFYSQAYPNDHDLISRHWPAHGARFYNALVAARREVGTQ